MMFVLVKLRTLKIFLVMKKFNLIILVGFIFIFGLTKVQGQDITSDLTVYYNFTDASLDVGIQDKATHGIKDDVLVNDGNVGFSIGMGMGMDGFGDALLFKNLTDIVEPGGGHSGMSTVALKTEDGADISDFQATTQLTYATWVKLPEGFDHVYAPIMLGAWNGPAKSGWNVICWGNVQAIRVPGGQFMFQVGNGNTNGGIFKSVIFPHPDGSTGGKGEWMHVAFTYNGEAGDDEKAMQSYFNGQLVVSDGASLLGSEVPDQITYEVGQGAAMNLRTSNEMTFDEVRIYKRALTANDIDALYTLKPDQTASAFSSKVSKSGVYVVSTKDNILKIKNAIAGMNYAIINIAGKVIEAGVLQSNSANINTSSWANGIYIVKIDNETFKVIN